MRVERRLNLGGTFICDRAVRSGDIDAYVEYSGTARTAIFHQPAETDARRAFEGVKRRYAEAGLTLLEPLGFENTFALLVRGDVARRLGLRTLSDAAQYAPTWRAGFGYEFLQREDGYPGLARTYGLRFEAPPTAMDLSLIYRALAQGQVDLVAGDATSGLNDAYGLVMSGTIVTTSRRTTPPRARAAVLLAPRGPRRARGTLGPHHLRHAPHEPRGGFRAPRPRRHRPGVRGDGQPPLTVAVVGFKG